MDEKELYSEFVEGTDDEEILDMFLTGGGTAVCCKCKTSNKIVLDPDNEEFICSKCDTKQLMPYLNPKYI